MSKKITAGPLVAEVKRLQKEFPEAVYHQKSNDGCSYSSGTVSKGPKTRGCLIGQALRNVYPYLFKTAKSDYDVIAVEEVLSNLNIVTTKNQLFYLQTVQENQDNGVCWGICHKDND